MSYIAPIHPPTSIRLAIKLHLFPAAEECLVVARANRLEIWQISGQDMECIHTKTVFGTVSMLQRLRPKDADVDILFFGTERFQYFTAVWDADTSQLVTKAELLDEAEQFMRRSQSQNTCLIDPTGRFMAMHLWEGVLNVLRLPNRKAIRENLQFLEQVRLTELWMKTSTFLPSETGHPLIAFLYKTRIDLDESKIAIYRLTADDRDTNVSDFDPKRDRRISLDFPDPSAKMLIPVPIVEDQVKRYHHRNTQGAKPHMGGMIVVGQTALGYIDALTFAQLHVSLSSPHMFATWVEYDSTRYFLGDEVGGLYLLTIISEGVVVKDMTVNPMVIEPVPDPHGITPNGRTSRASCLVNMGNDLVFVGSHYGDSQLLLVNLEHMRAQVVKTISNNAPILDFAIMDMGNREGDPKSGNTFSSGQARIVASCGAWEDGTLRSIRSGVGLEVAGVLDASFEDIRALFPVSSSGDRIDTLVVSLLTDTRIFRFDDDGMIEEVYDYLGLTTCRQTLLAVNLPRGRLLQVTPDAVTILHLKTGSNLSSWTPPVAHSVINASCNQHWLLLSVDWGRIMSFDLQSDLVSRQRAVGLTPGVDQDDQIACIHAATEPTNIGVVGFWRSGSISIINLENLEALHGESLKEVQHGSTSVPRDACLVRLHSKSTSLTLLVAMDDGNVVTFDVAKDFTLSGRKTINLGSRAARFDRLPQVDGSCNVFAATDNASLIYESEGRIVYSATSAENALCVAHFDAAAFPHAIVLATPSEIKICHVDAKRRTHVQVLRLYVTVRRIAYAPQLGVFGLGCIDRRVENDEEVVSSTFRVVDEASFKHLGTPFTLASSSFGEMVETVIAAELRDSSGEKMARFIVGTSFLIEEGKGSQGNERGCIYVLGVDDGRSPYLIMRLKVKAQCRALAVMGDLGDPKDPKNPKDPKDPKDLTDPKDLIVAGMEKSVTVYHYQQQSSTSGTLSKVVSHIPSTYPLDVRISGTTIGVMDMMQSLILLEYTPDKGGEKAKLVALARHVPQVFGTALCHLSGESWMQGDVRGNLIVLERNAGGLTPTDQAKMRITSEMNLGEQVNRIRRLHVPFNKHAVLNPQALITTVEGSVYLFGEIAPQYRDLLLTVQTRLGQKVKGAGLGTADFAAWRAYRDDTREAEEPFRFVDGEMLERFLDAGQSVQEFACDGLGLNVEQMCNLIEKLKGLH